MKRTLLLLVASVIILFSGCSRKTPEIDTSTPVVDSGYGNASVDTVPAYDDTSVVSNDNQINQMTGMDSSASYGSESERVSAVQSEVQTVYFATDSYKLSNTEIDKIDQNANIFNGDLASDLNIKIEGNCDEWGTDEYNYALGLKRAKYSKDSLVQAGVDESRMSLISYGESKPICAQHNAGCWQQNRRVDFSLLP
jgi:peptidoglycan-associated lipoprotein